MPSSSRRSRCNRFLDSHTGLCILGAEMIGWKPCSYACGCIDEDACVRAPKNASGCVYLDNGQCRCDPPYCKHARKRPEKPVGEISGGECICTHPIHGGKLWRCGTFDCYSWPWKSA